MNAFSRIAAAAAELRTFRDASGGAVSIFGLYLFVAAAIIGGLALDGMNLSQMRARMQVAADSAAHAAIYYMREYDQATSRSKAVAIGQAAVPPEQFGSALTTSDIETGFWSDATESFSTTGAGDPAVRATVRLSADRGNALRTFLLRLAGRESFDLEARATYVSKIDDCQTQGFAARGKVDIRSENTFLQYFCLHSNDFVEVNNGNYFESGVIVSMPDVNDLWMPGSGFSNNPGLEEALRSNELDFTVVDILPDIIEALDEPGSAYAPAFLSNSSSVDLDPKKLKSSDFRPGRVHSLTCTGNGGGAKATIPDNTTIENAVVISNCEIKFGRNILLRDAVLATTHTGDRSFNGSSGVTVGYNDGCQEGGGAKLITMGGMQFPGKLQIYGSQLIAAKDIVFAAQANGIYGASFVAGGEISGTSRMVFATCLTGVDDPFGTPVPRMVE